MRIPILDWISENVKYGMLVCNVLVHKPCAFILFIVGIFVMFLDQIGCILLYLVLVCSQVYSRIIWKTSEVKTPLLVAEHYFKHGEDLDELI